MTTGMFINHKIIALILVSAILINVALADQSAEFQKISSNPSGFAGKKVTLVGIAHIYGDRFFLYPNAITAQKSKIEKSAFVVVKPDATRYEKLDNHWLRITGTVDPSEHGPLGGAPFGIILDDLESLDRPPLKDPNVYGILRNDTNGTVTVQVSVKNGYSKFAISPGGTHIQTIDKTSVAQVMSPSGKITTKRALLPPTLPKEYSDSTNQRYYYRITNHSIEFVPPQLAKSWNRN